MFKNKRLYDTLLSIMLTISVLFPTLTQISKVAHKVKESANYSQYSSYSKHKVDTVRLDFKITSIVVQIERTDSFNRAFIVVGNDTFNLDEGDHEKEEWDKFSELIIFDKPIDSFIINKGNISGQLNYHFINTGDTPKIFLNYNEKRLNESCGKPQTIDQKDWREGLAPPSLSPSYTSVKHVIVHHSAGSNSNTDYTYVVRQIYVLHTQGNGWNDVGYNFLIAQNGAIYEGREGAGPNEENVLGSHFCGKNSQTMGICVLGNYETAEPTAAALNSLTRLISWKLDKANLNPAEYMLHPPSSANPVALGVIAGHRDGCTSECPGKNLYAKIPDIKQNVTTLMNSLTTAPATPQVAGNVREGPGAVTLSASGASDGNYVWSTSSSLTDTVPGADTDAFTTNTLFETTTFYVAIREGQCFSSLVPVSAEINVTRPYIFPNPAYTEEVSVLLNDISTYKKFSLINALGQEVRFTPAKIDANRLVLNISTLPSGLYFLKIASQQKSFSNPILIQ